MQYLEFSESLIVFQNAQGVEITAAIVRLGRDQIVFEMGTGNEVLRKSEVLSPFTIFLRNRPVYSGSAVIKEVLSTGLMFICEARLGEHWRDLDFVGSTQNGKLRIQFGEFVSQWQQCYRIGNDYKVVIADIHSFLTELHSWLQQVEFGLRSHPAGDRLEAEAAVVCKLEPPCIAYLTELFQRFEEISEKVPPESRPAHDAFARRHLHPLILTAPFAFRTFHKPLGYAGDYEMVNMMTRSPYEGASLFAKLFNCWLLQQAPAQAHRNRLVFLEQKFKEETARVHFLGRRTRILTLGCGPAVELQHLLAWPACDQCEFVLIDFNQETLSYTRAVLTEQAQKHARTTPLSFVKRSVQQILREAHKGITRPMEQAYDFIYCAGLFDYFPDHTCQRLLSILSEWLAPGGVLIATNIAPLNPFRQCMETFLDWHLNYRGVAQMLRLCPASSGQAQPSIKSDFTGVNVFVELRKAEHAHRSSTGPRESQASIYRQ